MDTALTIALVSEIAPDPDGDGELGRLLAEARSRGAGLAVLPEIPLNPWSPASRDARDEDAETPDGPRHQRLAALARNAGIGLLGGAIVRDPGDGRRYNTALLFTADGSRVHSYRKVHLPEEPGFWETSHYVPGTEPPAPCDQFGVSLGVQICSDINRPTGSFILAAMGAEVILCPRSTEQATYDRWRRVFRAVAMTACAFVLSVNRPRPEHGVGIGGPSIAVAPDGEVAAESPGPLTLVSVSPSAVAAARKNYPGYLDLPADLYARGWRAVAAGQRSTRQ